MRGCCRSKMGIRIEPSTVVLMAFAYYYVHVVYVFMGMESFSVAVTVIIVIHTEWLNLLNMIVPPQYD